MTVRARFSLAWPPGVKMKISTKGVKSGMYTMRLPFCLSLNLSSDAMKSRLAIKRAKQFLTFTEKNQTYLSAKWLV